MAPQISDYQVLDENGQFVVQTYKLNRRITLDHPDWTRIQRIAGNIFLDTYRFSTPKRTIEVRLDKDRNNIHSVTLTFTTTSGRGRISEQQIASIVSYVKEDQGLQGTPLRTITFT